MRTWFIYVFGRWIFLPGNVFWFVDKAIFKSHFKIPAFFPLWQIKENIVCADCGQICEGYNWLKPEIMTDSMIHNQNLDVRPVERKPEELKKKRSRDLNIDFYFPICRIN